ncbi:putative peptidyl-prolyl cis-trans isomerase FKBP4 [Apostichopus japonicus]|uniref:peptidylprolyl isomerase n=1 Tax=Stichopus japonicus TaxID=307972 RepID=A0A2G8L832_STIJA|nr:putative peptidyl-prolyl cis-trans isomerase FKBP4 [Apostichopus japonicus]
MNPALSRSKVDNFGVVYSNTRPVSGYCVQRDVSAAVSALLCRLGFGHLAMWWLQCAGQPRSEHGIVDGVEEGIQKMKKGETAQLKLKSKVAFGKEGNKEYDIPANAPVVYNIQLKELENAKDTWEMSVEEKIAVSEACKEKGSAFYKAGNIKGAMKKWKRIISIFETESGLKDDEKVKSYALQLAANLNMALAYLKLEEYPEAVAVCTTAFEFDANSEKGFFRRGQAYFGKTEYELAKQDFEKVLELSPDNKAAKNQVSICNQKIKQQAEKEKRLYKNMFDTILKENRDKEEEEEQMKREMAENVKNFSIENGGKEQTEEEAAAAAAAEEGAEEVETPTPEVTEGEKVTEEEKVTEGEKKEEGESSV